jgi:hypothetical protein
MVVLCANPACGAVLRVGDTYSPTQTVIRTDAPRHYFDCPRCGARSALPQRPDSDPAPGSVDQPTS